MSYMSTLYQAGISAEKISNYLKAHPGVEFDDALDILSDEGREQAIKGIAINIYPVAYIGLPSSDMLDEIRDELNCSADSNGQLLIDFETLSEEVEQMDDCELRFTLAGILAQIEGKAGDVWFYCR